MNLFVCLKKKEMTIIVMFSNTSPERVHTKQSKREGKDQESIQSSTTPDPGYQWVSDNFTIRHHKRERRGQPFPSDHKASINRRAQKHNKNKTEIT